MAEALYPYSREEAKREGELAQWKRSHQANVKCARDIKNLIASHTQEGRLEPGCVRAALDTWGFPRVQFVLSNTLRCANAQDFAPDALRWAQTAYVPYEKANGEFKIRADSALLAQFVQQIHAEYRALGMFGPEHCGADQDFTGKVLVLRPDRLKDACWSAQNQLWYGEKVRWNRTDFMGVLDEQYLPDWAAEKLAELRGPAQEQDAPDQGQADGPAQSGMEMG